MLPLRYGGVRKSHPKTLRLVQRTSRVGCVLSVFVSVLMTSLEHSISVTEERNESVDQHVIYWLQITSLEIYLHGVMEGLWLFLGLCNEK